MLIEMTVNGEQVRAEVAPGTRLASFLRDGCGLTGTKVSCGMGECGSCTVLIDGAPYLSCLLLAARVRGHVETIEGLAAESLVFREALAETMGFQCGYCTPGHVVQAVALAREASLQGADPSRRERISGNLCRCTGYSAILDAHEIAMTSHTPRGLRDDESPDAPPVADVQPSAHGDDGFSA